jgi:hypothetical protein
MLLQQLLRITGFYLRFKGTYGIQGLHYFHTDIPSADHDCTTRWAAKIGTNTEAALYREAKYFSAGAIYL